jgi:hypothetical protein
MAKNEGAPVRQHEAKRSRKQQVYDERKTNRVDRQLSEMAAQLLRLMSHPGYQAASTPVKLFALHAIVQWADGAAVLWRGVDTMADEMDVSERTVQTWLTEAEQLSVIAFPEGREGRGFVTNLVVVVAALERGVQKSSPVGVQESAPKQKEVEPGEREPGPFNSETPKPSTPTSVLESEEAARAREASLAELRAAFSRATAEAMPSTPSGLKAWDKALGEVLDAGATPEQITAAVEAWSWDLRWDWQVTPMGLAKHWHRLIERRVS